MALLAACQPEPVSYPVDIDATLQPYIDDFVVEGAERGLEVDFSQEGLIAQLQAIEEPGVPGQCQQHGSEANELYIDPAFWQVYSEEERTLLIFHELGHCYLDRDHLDVKDADGNCLSIMRSSSNVCDIDFTFANREAMLDELFEK